MKMKIQILNIVFAILMGSLFLTSCESESSSEEVADAKVEETRKELKKTKQDASLAAQNEEFTEEWNDFKDKMEEKIVNNDQRIAELKTKMEKAGKNRDERLVNRIDRLEQKNQELKSRIVTFESNPTNWQSFKREFSQDLSELGKSLKDFTVEN